MKDKELKKSNAVSRVLSQRKAGSTTIGSYPQMYDKLIERMQFVKKSYKTVSTYPVEPQKGRKEKREKYFEASYKFMQSHPEVSVQRIITITDLSKYDWVAETINHYRKCKNFSIGYLGAEEVKLPFLGIILFDSKELFLIAVTPPEEKALYIHSKDRYLCNFFDHYIESLWKNYCIQLKRGEKVFEQRLVELHSKLREPNFIEHDMGRRLAQTVRVGISQLDLTYLFKEEKGILVCTDKKALGEKVDRILGIAINEHVDLIVFPELSILEEMIEHVQRASAKNNIIIVAGSFYNEDRKNVCPIFIPKNYSRNKPSSFFTEKVNLSPYEISPVRNEGAISGNNINIFYNSVIGTFAVLICADYLDKNIVNILYRRKIDILIVCSLNADSEKFSADMSRDCELSRHGVYILYSNAIYIKGRQKVLGDGQSSISGKMHDKFIEKIGRKPPRIHYRLATLGRKSEGIVFATIDLLQKKPLLWGPESKPNVEDISLHKMAL